MLVVNPCHKTKRFILMAFINVFDVGEKHAAWKYFSKYCAVLSLQRIIFIDWVKGVFFVASDSGGAFNDVLLFCLVVGIYHKPLPEQLLLPCSINFPLFKA